MMTFGKCVFAAAAMMALSGAHASGSGEVTKEGKTTKLTTAYACRRADHFDATKMLTVVVFSSEPVDMTKVDTAGDCLGSLESQLDQQRVTYVELEIASDGSVEQIALQAPGLGSSGSGGADKPVLIHNDEHRIEGTFRTSDEKKKTGGFGAYYDLTFALDIPAATKKQ